MAALSCGGTSSSDPTAAASGGSGGATSTAPTFWEDVAPIIYEECASCHAGVGVAPFELITYEQVSVAGHVVRTEVEARRMPPWHADNSGDCNTYKDARWLTDEQIATVGAWADGGYLEGDSANAPELPGPAPSLTGVTNTLDPGVSYTPNAAVSDDYRCFVVDPQLDEDMFLSGYEVKPGDLRMVHHVILFSLDSADGTSDVEARDAAEEGPGYTCYGGIGGPSSFAAGWAPGTTATDFPAETGIRLAAGRKAVMQVHYNTVNGVYPDRTTIDLRLESDVAFPATITSIRAQDLVLPPGLESVEASTTIDNPASNPVRLHGVIPHMHELGQTINVSLGRDGDDVCVVDVPEWDFNWQQLYLFEEPLVAQPTDTVTITCAYNTTGQTDTVTWGEGTQDEMCQNFFYTLFAKPSVFLHY